jgi:CO/xanthine dehydrogenase FAD-binding subunit
MAWGISGISVLKSVLEATCNSKTSRNPSRKLASVLQDFYKEDHRIETTRVSMDLNTVTEIARPQTRAQLPVWTAGDAWLAGGTWLFSDPQVHLTRLIDLTDLKWPALTIGDTSLTIAATCTVAQLDALICPPEWIASPLINQCCRAFLASFKIWKTATVGGNLCMSLPAGPMISLTAALDGVCMIWKADGSEQKIDVVDFVTGSQRNVLAPGDLLRQIDIPLAALKRRSAFRQISLTPVGRSAALLIGSLGSDGALALTVTASTARPVRLSFAGIPQARQLREAILEQILDGLYHNDIHGKPAWRKHMTLRLAEEIRDELQSMPQR